MPTMSPSGSNSAVSGFLRHGCFTPETGHWLALGSNGRQLRTCRRAPLGARCCGTNKEEAQVDAVVTRISCERKFARALSYRGETIVLTVAEARSG
jgi:hypothetical protein